MARATVASMAQNTHNAALIMMFEKNCALEYFLLKIGKKDSLCWFSGPLAVFSVDFVKGYHENVLNRGSKTFSK